MSWCIATSTSFSTVANVNATAHTHLSAPAFLLSTPPNRRYVACACCARKWISTMLSCSCSTICGSKKSFVKVLQWHQLFSIESIRKGKLQSFLRPTGLLSARARARSPALAFFPTLRRCQRLRAGYRRRSCRSSCRTCGRTHTRRQNALKARSLICICVIFRLAFGNVEPRGSGTTFA